MSFAEDNAKAWNEIPELTKLASEPPESANGPGATLAATALLREELPDLFARHNIRSVLDIGCGDWNWMSRVSLDLDEYIGWDVSITQIEANRMTFGRSFPLRFQCRNLLTVEASEIPKVDLILCRHVLIHFPNEHIAAVLDKLRASGSRFLLASHWPDSENKDHGDDDGPVTFRYRGYMERTVNLTAPPFYLFSSSDGIVEPAQPGVQHVLAERHYLALFELQRMTVVAGGTGQEPTWELDQPTRIEDRSDPGGLRIVTPQEYIEMHGSLPTNNPRYADESVHPVNTGEELPEARVTVTDPDTGITRIMGPGTVGTRPDAGEGVPALDPNCEHRQHYRTHTADGRMLEKCSQCHGLIDESKSDAVEGEGISFMGALSRFGEKVQRQVDDEQMAKKLVLVDKDKLRELRDKLREDMAPIPTLSSPNVLVPDPGLEATGKLIGTLAQVLDELLTEMTRDDQAILPTPP